MWGNASRGLAPPLTPPPRGRGTRLVQRGAVDFFPPWREEGGMAVRPARGSGGGCADRLERLAAQIGVRRRQRGGRAEARREPGPDLGADQPLVKEAIGRE